VLGKDLLQVSTDNSAGPPIPKGLGVGAGAGDKIGAAAGTPGSGMHATSLKPGTAQWNLLREAIARRVVYPDVGRRMGWQGRVMIAFYLQKDGQVADVRVLESSGHAALDQNAIQAVYRASPMPSVGEKTQVVVPIVFALR
jgi:protein TonB